MSMDALVIVYTLYGDHGEAERIVEEVVKAGLAACANILSPSESYYMWNGLLERQREYPVLFKTTAARREALMAQIAEKHSYDLPAILSWDADATPGYAQWVGDMTQGA
ncbi:MAG TPA: divalent-cation tolerance protein CutA [Sphingobium sp.]